MFTSSFLGGWIGDFLSKVLLGWLDDVRGYFTTKELGRTEAQLEGLKRATDEERRAREAAERATEDPFIRD